MTLIIKKSKMVKAKFLFYLKNMIEITMLLISWGLLILDFHNLGDKALCLHPQLFHTGPRVCRVLIGWFSFCVWRLGPAVPMQLVAGPTRGRATWLLEVALQRTCLMGVMRWGCTVLDKNTINPDSDWDMIIIETSCLDDHQHFFIFLYCSPFTKI